jgi:hypothetical protein
MEDINIALLIDADNVSSRYIPLILSELSKFGKITVRRMYGDWSQDRLHSWLKASSGYSLTPIMQPNNTPGKNASDIGLIIDAMDILYTGEVQGFCICSSDGDFNKLATRLREAGKVVIGMGEKKTPESFRVSCERFIFLDVLSGGDSDEESVPSRKSRKKAAAPAPSKKKKSSQTAEPLPDPVQESGDDLSPDSDGDEGDIPAFTDKSVIEDEIINMITDNSAEGKETGLGEIGSRLVKIFPDFDTRNYHYSKLSEFLMDFPSLTVENRDNAVWVSLRAARDSDIEDQILQIYRRHQTSDMYLSALKKELEKVNPNLDATIKKSGVTRFSVYLNRNIHSLEVNGRYASLKNPIV